MKAAYLLIGCLCAAANVASTAFGDTTLYIQSTSAQLGVFEMESAVIFTFPTPTDALNNYGHIQAVFNAPAGYAFRFSGGEFSAAIEYGRPSTSDDATDSLFENSTIEFVPGMASSIIYYSPTVYANDSVYYRGYPVDPGCWHVAPDQEFQLGGPVEFTSLTLQWKVETDCTSLAPFGVGLFVADGFSFVPIPEPSIAALALLGACATAWRLRSRREA